MTNDEFGELLVAHSKPAARMAWAIMKNSSDVEDVLQEAAIAAFRSLRALRNVQSFGSWFRRIVVNKAKDELYKRWREERRVSAFRDAAVPPDAFQSLEDIMDVIHAVGRLPDCHRRVVRLHFVEGYSTPEIAKLLRQPQGTVRRLLSEAYKRVRKELGG